MTSGSPGSDAVRAQFQTDGNAAAPNGATLGIDIGGTFADIVLMGVDARMYKTKVASSFRDMKNGIVPGIVDLLRESGIAPADIGVVIHGTTVATNAILEQKGALTGLLTTSGFRDVLELARLRRPSSYDSFWDKPVPLVRRAHRLELDERLDHQGMVIRLLDPDQVRERLAQLQRDGVSSVAVCLLHSHRNNAHERAIQEIACAEFPALHLSLSCDVSPEIKEYERTSTTVINAYVQPVVERYIGIFVDELRRIGVDCPLHIMQSNGGMVNSELARRFPVTIIESGPAAGILATSYLARASAANNLIALDVGGTTAKASLINDGNITVSNEFEVGAGLNVGNRFSKGGGYPIRVPSVDVAEVGSGGGSIAWIDSGGVLTVGPRSAGAEPGPACYGTGGTEPTVTDANVVLGYLNPERLAGGRMRINRLLAVRAIEDRVAKPLGISTLEAAYGIYQIANANMMRAVRAVSTDRGKDPRAHDLVAFGGAGPVHGADMASLLDMTRVLIPVSPGLFSAVGLHFADTTRDFVRSLLAKLAHLSSEELVARLRTLTDEAHNSLRQLGFGDHVRQVNLRVDLRHMGQSHELSVTPPPLDASDFHASLIEKFAQAHEASYGFRGDSESIEIVNLRAAAVGLSLKLAYAKLWQALARTADHVQPAGTREAYFGPVTGLVRCDVIPGRHAIVGRLLVGPAIIEEFDTTIVVPPGFEATVDTLGNVTILRRSS